MTTIKLKFRPSRIVEAKGTLYLQVIHKRVVRQVRTGCHILASEWDKDSASLIFPRKNVERVRYLMEVQNRIEFLSAQLEGNHLLFRDVKQGILGRRAYPPL